MRKPDLLISSAQLFIKKDLLVLFVTVHKNLFIGKALVSNPIVLIFCTVKIMEITEKFLIFLLSFRISFWFLEVFGLVKNFNLENPQKGDSIVNTVTVAFGNFVDLFAVLFLAKTMANDFKKI